MFGIGMTELMVILVIGLLVLGPKRLPELARSLGKGLAEFRRASSDLRREFLDVADEARIEPPKKRAEPGKPERGDAEPGRGEPGAGPSKDAPRADAAEATPEAAGEAPKPAGRPAGIAGE